MRGGSFLRQPLPAPVRVAAEKPMTPEEITTKQYAAIRGALRGVPGVVHVFSYAGTISVALGRPADVAAHGGLGKKLVTLSFSPLQEDAPTLVRPMVEAILACVTAPDRAGEYERIVSAGPGGVA